MARLPALCFGCSRDEVLGHHGEVIAAQGCQGLHALVIGCQKLAVSRGQDVVPQGRSGVNFFYEGPMGRRHVIPHSVQKIS